MSILSTVAGAALSFIPGGKIGAYALAVLVGGGAVLGLYAHWRSSIYNQGKEDTLNAIARNDAKIVAQARSRRRLVVDCDAGGMHWDQTTGKCVGQ